uniref:Iron-sulfur cluster assembly enzyme n=1 Tax=Ovis aries TaxID=9940 RepID=A0AC11D8Z2_SHEEP
MAAAGAGRLRRAASALLLRPPRLPARELSAPARLYHKKVVDHYENPRNVGSLDKTSKNVGTGLVGAPACGDVMKLQIQVDEQGRIVDARFKTFGCGSAIASSSLATEWVKGKTDFPGNPVVKNPPTKAGDICLVPHLGRSYIPWGNQARALELKSRTATEPEHSRACAPQQGEPLQRETPAPRLESSPSSLRLEKAHAWQRRPSIAKNKQIKM